MSNVSTLKWFFWITTSINVQIQRLARKKMIIHTDINVLFYKSNGGWIGFNFINWKHLIISLSTSVKMFTARGTRNTSCSDHLIQKRTQSRRHIIEITSFIQQSIIDKRCHMCDKKKIFYTKLIHEIYINKIKRQTILYTKVIHIFTYILKKWLKHKFDFQLTNKLTVWIVCIFVTFCFGILKFYKHLKYKHKSAYFFFKKQTAGCFGDQLVLLHVIAFIISVSFQLFPKHRLLDAFSPKLIFSSKALLISEIFLPVFIASILKKFSSMWMMHFRAPKWNACKK